jgi:hypothetical protein
MAEPQAALNGEIFQSPSTGKRYLRTPDGNMIEGHLMSSQATGQSYWSVEGELTPVILNNAKVPPAPPGAADVQITGQAADPHADRRAYDALPNLNKGVRAGGEFIRGAADQANAYLGGILDLSAAAPEALGLTVPGRFRENIGAGLDMAGEAATGAAAKFIGDMGPPGYRSNLDAAARGAGKSTVDTGTMLGAGRLLRMAPKVAKQAGVGNVTNTAAGSARRRIGQVLNEQRGMQMIAGGTGGAAHELGNDPYTSMGISAATPSVAGLIKGGIRRLGSPLARSLTSSLSKQRKAMTAIAKSEGIPMTAGQITNSKFLQVLESSFAQLPITARHQMALFHEQRAAFNRAVLRRAGMTGDDASPQAIDDHFLELGSRYQRLAERTRVTMDGEMFKELDDIIFDYSGHNLPDHVASQFKGAVESINRMRQAAGLGRTGGDGAATPTGSEVGPFMPDNARTVSIDGTTYQNIVSGLKRSARETTEPGLRNAMNRLASMMDGAMERTAEFAHKEATTPPPGSNSGQAIVPYNPNAPHIVPPPTGKDLRREYLELNKNYRNLLIIANAMTKGTQAERTDAMVPLSGLKRAVEGFDGTVGYARGKGDMNELARVGDLLASTNMPDSFTGIRNVVLRMMQSGPAALAAGTAVAGADAGTVVASGTAGLTVPRLVQKAYQSPLIQGYLRNQKYRPGPTKQTDALLRKVIAAQAQGQIIDDLQETQR